MGAVCRLCCKSPKLPGDKILAIRRTNRRPPIYAASVTLPSSPARSSSGDEVPHIFTRKSRLQPGEFLITSAKRLLQQNLPISDMRVVESRSGSPRVAGFFFLGQASSLGMNTESPSLRDLGLPVVALDRS